MTDRNGVTDRTGWSTPSTIFSGDSANAGEYCQIAVDYNGGIHIAAYDSTNTNLVYAYASSYTGTFQTCVVDDSISVGEYLTLDVGLDSSGYPVPNIAYYGSACVRPKYAYLVDNTSMASGVSDGGSDDLFTGSWECAIVPTSSTVNKQSNQHNKINVGLWKTTAGLITTDPLGGSNTSSYSNTANGYSSTSYGSVYGNGTANAILGYAIKASSSAYYVETAQMK